MGATNFVHAVDAATAKDGFDELCADAVHEFGHDAYNGTISTCVFQGDVKTVAGVFSEESERAGYDFVEACDYGVKWIAKAVDCGIVGYEVWQYKRRKTEKAAPPKYRMAYVLANWKGNRIDDKAYGTLTEAKKAVIELLAGRGARDFVSILKQPVLVSGNAESASFDLSRRRSRVQVSYIPPRNSWSAH